MNESQSPTSPRLPAKVYLDGQLLATGDVNWSDNPDLRMFWPKPYRLLDKQHPRATLIIEGREKEPVQLIDLRNCHANQNSGHWDFEIEGCS